MVLDNYRFAFGSRPSLPTTGFLSLLYSQADVVACLEPVMDLLPAEVADRKAVFVRARSLMFASADAVNLQRPKIRPVTDAVDAADAERINTMLPPDIEGVAVELAQPAGTGYDR